MCPSKDTEVHGEGHGQGQRAREGEKALSAMMGPFAASFSAVSEEQRLAAERAAHRRGDRADALGLCTYTKQE